MIFCNEKRKAMNMNTTRNAEAGRQGDAEKIENLLSEQVLDAAVE